MVHEIDVSLEYGRGHVGVMFDAEDWPENWTDVQEYARADVKEAIFELADRHEWYDAFETAQEYSPPGMSPEPDVGSITVDGDDITVNLDIDSINDCEGF